MSAVNSTQIAVNIEVIGVNTSKMTKNYKHKGGKGFKSPYETTHMRIPLPLKNQIAKAKEDYDNFIENGGEPNNPPAFLNSPEKINEILSCLHYLKRFVSGNIFICKPTNVCPNWTHTLRVINELEQITKR
ncbi:MAG TPA: hypothetical protein VIQ31_04630 [Phormidium sp.]